MEDKAEWRGWLESELASLGHRNWIVVADSAYPWQTSPGVETVCTGEDHLEVLKEVLHAVEKAPHLRADIFLDDELSYVTEDDAPGIDALRKALEEGLAKDRPERVSHEQIMAKLDGAGKHFHVLVLKTTLILPYTSVFVKLNCGYWGDAAERRLRERMQESRW